MAIAVIIFCCNLVIAVVIITVSQQSTNISSLDDVSKSSSRKVEKWSYQVSVYFHHHHCHCWCKELTGNKSPWGCHHVIVSSCCADSIEQKQWGWSWIISHSRLLSQQRYWTMKPENHFCSTMSFWPEPLHNAVQFSRAWKSGQSLARQ